MDKLRRNLLPIKTFVRIDVKRLFRDKVAIFFVFVFPLIFLAIFGGIFGRDSELSFRVAVINESDFKFAREFEAQLKENEILKVDEEIKSVVAAEEEMSRGQLDAAIILPEEFGAVKQPAKYPGGEAKVLYSQNNQQAGAALGSILEGVLDEVNAKISPPVTPFTVTTESTADEGLSQFDYVFSGMLGFTVLSLGIFGPTTVFPRLKSRGVLRRYQVTTLKVWQYFTANVLSNAIIGLIAVALMFAAALTVFDLNMRGSYLNLAVVAVLGVTMLFGIGLAIGGWAKNENQAAPLSQLVVLPMMFLSGVFFPTFLMPEFLQKVTQFIPLTPIIDSFRLIITENASLTELGPQLGVIVAWMVIIYAIAFKVFRWE